MFKLYCVLKECFFGGFFLGGAGFRVAILLCEALGWVVGGVSAILLSRYYQT